MALIDDMRVALAGYVSQHDALARGLTKGSMGCLCRFCAQAKPLLGARPEPDRQPGHEDYVRSALGLGEG